MLTIHGEKTYLLEFGKQHLENPDYYSWLRDLDVIQGINRLEYLLSIDPIVE